MDLLIFILSGRRRNIDQRGFTLIELVLIVVILGTLSVVAVVKWPSGMKEAAAIKELKQAVRHAQHKAMTRPFRGAASAWGIEVNANQYTIKRADDSELAEKEYQNRLLLDDSAMTLSGPAIWFNGLGEPITDSGGLLTDIAPRTFTINSTEQLTVCTETGYIREGSTCP